MRLTMKKLKQFSLLVKLLAIGIAVTLLPMAMILTLLYQSGRQIISISRASMDE